MSQEHDLLVSIYHSEVEKPSAGLRMKRSLGLKILQMSARLKTLRKGMAAHTMLLIQKGWLCLGERDAEVLDWPDGMPWAQEYPFSGLSHQDPE